MRRLPDTQPPDQCLRPVLCLAGIHMSGTYMIEPQCDTPASWRPNLQSPVRSLVVVLIARSVQFGLIPTYCTECRLCGTNIQRSILMDVNLCFAAADLCVLVLVTNPACSQEYLGVTWEMNRAVQTTPECPLAHGHLPSLGRSTFKRGTLCTLTKARTFCLQFSVEVFLPSHRMTQESCSLSERHLAMAIFHRLALSGLCSFVNKLIFEIYKLYTLICARLFKT